MVIIAAIPSLIWNFPILSFVINTTIGIPSSASTRDITKYINTLVKMKTNPTKSNTVKSGIIYFLDNMMV